MMNGLVKKYVNSLECLNVEMEKIMVCSTAHITRKDNAIFSVLSSRFLKEEGCRWVLDIFYGYIVNPSLLRVPALTMRNEGLSESTIFLLTEGLDLFGASLVRFDCDGPILESFPTYKW